MFYLAKFKIQLNLLNPYSNKQALMGVPIHTGQQGGSCIKNLQDGDESFPSPSNNGVLSNQLPKLNVGLFDSDSLNWVDWTSRLKAVIHDAKISKNGRISLGGRVSKSC
jgi:hypothetical protein